MSIKITSTGGISALGGLSSTQVNNYFACNVGIGTNRPSAGLTMPDTYKVALGDSSDLELYHDSGNNWITTPVGGNLMIQSNGLALRSNAQENYLNATANADVALYYDNSKKFETTCVGVKATGAICGTGNLDIDGHSTLMGNLSVRGTVTCIDTRIETTSAIEVQNAGTGPAILANQLGSQPVVDFQDDGTSAFYIENGGNVGIGLTDPTSPLHVEGPFTISRTGVTSHKSTIDMDGNFRFAAHSGYSMTFHTDETNVGGTEIVRFRNDTGNVGIGNTEAGQKLTVSGNISASGSLSATGAGYNWFASRVGIGDGTSARTAAAELTVQDGEVQVGLGATKGYDFHDFGTGWGYKGVTGASRLGIFTDASERLTVNANGCVGIGTTDPQKALEISKANTSGGGVIRLAGTGETSAGCAAGSIQFYNGDTTDYTPGVFGIIRGVAGPSGGEGHLQFLTDMPSEGADACVVAMQIHSNASVGIGSTSPNEKLTVAGNISACGDVCIGDDLVVNGESITVCGAAAMLNFCDTTDSDDMYMTFANAGTAYACVGYMSTADFDICTNNRDISLLPGTANVGIGETSPGQKLTVAGNLSACGSHTGKCFVKIGGTSSEFLKADGSVDSTCYGTGTTTASNSQTFTNKSGNISQWTNDCGYTTATGDITNVNAGVGLTGGGGSGSVTLCTDLSELPDMTASFTAADELIVLDSSAQHRKPAGEIGNSVFINDSNFTTCEGTTTPSNSQTFTNKGGNISQWTNDCSYTGNTGTTTASNSQTFTNKSGNISQWTNDCSYTTNTGTVNTTGTPVDNDFAKFTDADTIEGRSIAETKSDLSLNNVENKSSATIRGEIVSGNIPNNAADTTGNAATATALATARTIASVSFDGTGNISLNNNAITNGAGYTTNTGTTTPSNSQTFTNKSGNISQWTNNCSYGKITCVQGSGGLCGSGSSGTVTVCMSCTICGCTLNLSCLPTSSSCLCSGDVFNCYGYLMIV